VLIIHAGFPKTGTTAFQIKLDYLRDQLRDVGIFYPVGQHESGPATHHEYSLGITQKTATGEELALRLIAEMEQSQLPNTLISSEAFTNCLSNRLRAEFCNFLTTLSNTTDVRLVLALRRMDSFMQSMYLHLAKVDEISIPVDEFLSTRWNWALNVFSALAEFQQNEVVQEIELIKYSSDPAFRAEIFRALRLEDVQHLFGKNKKINVSLGYKAQAFLLFSAELCEKYCPDLDAAKVAMIVRAQVFQFENDLHDYSIIRHDDRIRLHQDALNAAEETGITAYSTFFGDDILTEKEHVELHKGALEPRDFQRLVDFMHSRPKTRK